MNYKSEAPQPVREFLVYHDTIKGQSSATVDSYYLDLRTFTRYLMLERSLVPRDTPLDQIEIKNIGIDLYESVSLGDIYDFLAFLSRDRELNAKSRARMISTLKGFYNYLTIKTKQITNNPVLNLDAPKIPKTLPSYLTLEESQRLLQAVDGRNKTRDYCIISLFLNCGLRISEMVGLNLSDIRQDHLLIHGKGNKERIVYLNNACANALENWLEERKHIQTNDVNAVFLSARRKRISVDSVQLMVRNTLLKARLDASRISPHKLRHTAATLMLQHGVDVRTLQEVLGHENLNTTQIYTHIGNTEMKRAADANPLSEFYATEKTTE